MDPQELINRIHQQNSYEHRILYYGPSGEKELLATINKLHNAPRKLTKIVPNDQFKMQLTDQTKVFIAPYEAKQIYMSQISNRGEKFDPSMEPVITSYSIHYTKLYETAPK